MSISQAFGIVRMAQFGPATERDDESRSLIFSSVQFYVFSEEDKQAYLQFSDADQVMWLKGVKKAATKVWRYEIHASARDFFQNYAFGPIKRNSEYQSNLGLDGSTKCIMNL